jgi:dephospho-CoA kinase
MSFASDKTVIGLTGGIACGKSSALKIFQELGWQTLSTDRIAATVIAEDQIIIEKLRSRWGGQVFSSSQVVIKSKIAEIVFNDKGERDWLEGILHPIIRSTWIQTVESSKSKFWVVEIPLLFEKNLQSFFDYTISLQCSENVQKKRLYDRGLTKGESNARMESQLPMDLKSQLADIVLLGENSLSFLKRQICIFHARVT